MERWKVCPACGEKNNPVMLECVKCGTDLTAVKLETEAKQKQPAQSQPKKITPPVVGAKQPAPSQKQLVRLCNCGEVNAPNSRKCRRCGENISDIIPLPLDEAQKKLQNTNKNGNEPKNIEIHRVFFESIDHSYNFELKQPELTIGREAAMSEYLATKPYVSRTQCKITVREGKIYIENLSKTNFTYVNNEKVSGIQRINPNDEIGLGGVCKNNKRQAAAAYLILRVE